MEVGGGKFDENNVICERPLICIYFQMAAFMTLNKEQAEEMPNDNEKVLQHYIEKMGDLIAVSDEGVSQIFSFKLYSFPDLWVIIVDPRETFQAHRKLNISFLSA